MLLGTLLIVASIIMHAEVFRNNIIMLCNDQCIIEIKVHYQYT